jgi:F-type H+-transporting ATPase subunit a
MFFLMIGVVLTIIFFMLVRSSINKSRKTDLVPVGIGNLGEAGYAFVRTNIVGDVLGEQGAKYTGFVATVFFAVLFQNLLGLIPGFKPGTGTLGTTFTWAIIVFIWMNAIGFKKHGVVGFLKSFLPKGTPLLLAPIIYILEIISHFLRPFTLGVRLYANMYAGHIVLGVFAIFVEMALHDLTVASAVTGVLSFAMQVIMYAFEVFVAVLQAYIFAILTAVYINMAVHAGEH